MARKAQGMPMNVIIIAVLALLVLVILSVMLMGKTRTYGKTVSSCATQGGECMLDKCGPDEAEVFDTKDCTDHCCIQVYGGT